MSRYELCIDEEDWDRFLKEFHDESSDTALGVTRADSLDISDDEEKELFNLESQNRSGSRSTDGTNPKTTRGNRRKKDDDVDVFKEAPNVKLLTRTERDLESIPTDASFGKLNLPLEIGFHSNQRTSELIDKEWYEELNRTRDIHNDPDVVIDGNNLIIDFREYAKRFNLSSSKVKRPMKYDELKQLQYPRPQPDAERLKRFVPPRSDLL